MADAPEMDPSDPLYRQFAHIFETFKISDPAPSAEQGDAAGQSAADSELAPQQPQDLKKVSPGETLWHSRHHGGAAATTVQRW